MGQTVWVGTQGPESMIRLTGHNDAVVGLAFEPRGALLASASRDASVRLWQLPKGIAVVRLTGQHRPAASVEFSADGSMLAGSFRGLVSIWRVAHWQEELATWYGNNRCDNLRYCKTNRVFAYIDGHYVRMYDVVGRTIRPPIRRMVCAFDFDVFGNVVLVNHDGSVDYLDIESGRTRRLFRFSISSHRCGTRCLPLDSGIVFVHSQFLRIYDGPPNRTPRIWQASETDIYAVAVLPADGQVLTGGADGLVKRWDIVTGHALDTWDFGIGEVFSLAVSSDGLTAAAGGLTDIVVWDLAG